MTDPQASAAADRSVLRNLRKTGARGVDGRGRVAAMPAILHYGFRPFFFAAGLHAGLAVPIWLWIMQSGVELAGPLPGVAWHAHEMLWGYLAAVVAGFILTAVPNWTGRLPLSGWPLLGLVALWAAGRLACALVAAPVLAGLIDVAFPAALAACVWREVIGGRNWRNAPVAGMLTLFGLANALHHLEARGWAAADGLALRLGLGVAALMIAMIGGRIVPSFTRNWLVKQGSPRLPKSFGRLDKAAMLATGFAAILWVGMPGGQATGWALTGAGVLLGARLACWRGILTLREPIVAVLHLGYLWLAASLVLLGLAALRPEWLSTSSALHALTAGAVGTMTLAVMTRASLGHTGREIRADLPTVAAYALVSAGAMLRVAGGMADELHMPLLVGGGALWSGGFLLFALRYGPILWAARVVR